MLPRLDFFGHNYEVVIPRCALCRVLGRSAVLQNFANANSSRNVGSLKKVLKHKSAGESQRHPIRTSAPSVRRRRNLGYVPKPVPLSASQILRLSPATIVLVAFKSCKGALRSPAHTLRLNALALLERPKSRTWDERRSVRQRSRRFNQLGRRGPRRRCSENWCGG